MLPFGDGVEGVDITGAVTITGSDAAVDITGEVAVTGETGSVSITGDA